VHRVVAALVGLVSIGVTACVISGPKSRKISTKPKLTDHQRREAVARRESGEETLAEIGRSYNVSGWTISRLTV
jgi:hypothetical protein